MFSRLRKKFIGYKELKYLAYHDSMTGLYNRNWLYKNIHSIDHKYVYFIDINNLKQINLQGHTFGDEHIKKVVRHLQYRMHSTHDILVRYAGDEFILFTH
jgi:diguanylate cyclase (GGDEF)-like protein